MAAITAPITVAAVVARFLKARGPATLFALQGGHIQPIWDEAVRLGVRIVDVRDERAAVHMAQAWAELTGEVGIAMVTAGPGVTNALTGIANAFVARTPLLVIAGAPPRPQTGAGALQDLPQIELARPITRLAASLRNARNLPAQLDQAMARALGDGGDSGPVLVEIPTDVLRERLEPALILDEHFAARPPRELQPHPRALAQATALLREARRPLVIGGRGARAARDSLIRLLDATGALYLDTQESRGAIPDSHPAVVAAMRGKAMRGADLVVLIGRRLDYQLGYGSPAVFPQARFLRIGESASELGDGRRAAAEVMATPALALDALAEALSDRPGTRDQAWIESLRSGHVARQKKLHAEMSQAMPGADGYMHPYRLLGAIQQALDPDSVVVADGGDILSFARIALSAGAYLDPGALGCLGVGVPYGVAAALACPGRKVVSINGDGAFGFNAMELDTAVRHDAPAVFVVANNGGWNIERYDQMINYGGRINGAELRRSDYAALARGLGLHAERIEQVEALPEALARAFARAPALLDVQVSRDAVSPDATSGLAGVPDLQALATWDEAERKRGGQA